jgi:hypothetical protein
MTRVCVVYVVYGGVLAVRTVGQVWSDVGCWPVDVVRWRGWYGKFGNTR